LYGRWLAFPTRIHEPYSWWDKSLYNRCGRWVTAGRSALNPIDEVITEDGITRGIWGYLFFVPKTGKPANGRNFGQSFETTANRLINKRINPHLLRSVWATWAYQRQLSDAEIHSLAYAMGHTVTTLRELYEKATTTDKLEPIQAAIQRDEATPPRMDADTVSQFVEQFRSLPMHLQQQIRATLGG
jgi:integrase